LDEDLAWIVDQTGKNIGKTDVAPDDAMIETLRRALRGGIGERSRSW
jgi:hypothetical protein